MVEFFIKDKLSLLHLRMVKIRYYQYGIFTKPR